MSDKRQLSDWLDGFITLTDNSEPPLLFRKWSGIATIAAALQRKCRLTLGISLTFYPNFYIVLVGPSATGKGTAMSYAYDLIKNIPGIRLSAQATTLQALIRRMKETNLTDTDIETGKQHMHSSLTIFSNEFTAFLGYHNLELMTALCDWYDCHDRWVYDTIKRDREEVLGVWVNILGGTTPDNIKTSIPMEAIGGGLTSRIIFVNEEKTDKIVIFPSATSAELELQQILIQDLEKISLMSGQFHMTENATGFYTEWCYEAKLNPPFRDTKFDGYCGRRRKHLLSLAMVCSASRNDLLVITLEDIERAAKLLAEVEVRMGLTFKGIGKSNTASLVSDAILYLTTIQKIEIPLWEFSRHFEEDMDKMMMDRVLDTLEASKYIQRVKKPGYGWVIKIFINQDIPKNGLS